MVKNVSEGIGTKITINLTSSNTEYFKVTSTVVDDTLQAGEETDVRVKVELLKTPINSPITTSVLVNLTATPMENAEASGGETKEVIKPTPLVYTIYGVDNIYVDTDISSMTRKYNTFQEATTVYGHPAALSHETENGLVKVSYVAFTKNGNVYYLKGRINESSSTEKTVFNQNVSVLKEAFGPNWELVCDEYNNRFDCSDGDLNAYARDYGQVVVSGDTWNCSIDSSGFAKCY